MASVDDNERNIYIISGIFAGVIFLLCILTTMLFAYISKLTARVKILEGSLEQVWGQYTKKSMASGGQQIPDEISVRGFQIHTGNPSNFQNTYPGNRHLGQNNPQYSNH